MIDLLQMLLAPNPSPSPMLDPTQVSPGLAGFLVTFTLAGMSVLLFVSMARRLRRVHHRSRVAQDLSS